MLSFESERSKDNILIGGGLSSISVGFFTWENKPEAAQEVNFNQMGIYCSYHMLSRPSQGISCCTLLFSPPPTFFYKWNYMNINFRKTLKISMLYEQGGSWWVNRGEKGEMGQQLFGVAKYCLVSSSLSHCVAPTAWGPGEWIYQFLRMKGLSSISHLLFII